MSFISRDTSFLVEVETVLGFKFDYESRDFGGEFVDFDRYPGRMLFYGEWSFSEEAARIFGCWKERESTAVDSFTLKIPFVWLHLLTVIFEVIGLCLTESE